MASRFERFITSHLGTTEHFYGSRMGGDGERHRVGLIIRRILGSEILRAYFWTGGVGGGVCITVVNILQNGRDSDVCLFVITVRVC